MSVKYIADLHLYDSYSYQWRTELDLNLDAFASMQIDKWNYHTAPDDTVIIVGDVGRLCPMTEQVLHRLNGTKILVIGNHDESWGSKMYDSSLFAGTHRFIKWDDVYVTHIPNEEVRRECQSTYFVHGHHHRYDAPGMQFELRKYACDTYRLNCATDLIGYTPRTLPELILQKEQLLDKLRERGLLTGGL